MRHCVRLPQCRPPRFSFLWKKGLQIRVLSCFDRFFMDSFDEQPLIGSQLAPIASRFLTSSISLDVNIGIALFSASCSPQFTLCCQANVSCKVRLSYVWYGTNVLLVASYQGKDHHFVRSSYRLKTICVWSYVRPSHLRTVSFFWSVSWLFWTLWCIFHVCHFRPEFCGFLVTFPKICIYDHSCQVFFLPLSSCVSWAKISG